MTLLSVQDVADKYGFSASQIRRLIRKGTIKAHLIGSFYAIDERSVKSLQRSRPLNKPKDKDISNE